jgi:hypothetical protein
MTSSSELELALELELELANRGAGIRDLRVPMTSSSELAELADIAILFYTCVFPPAATHPLVVCKKWTLPMQF